MLTAKQERFCEEYMKDSNGRQAAIRAGYAPKNAEVTASKYLRLSNVKEHMAGLRAELSAECGYTVEQALAEYEQARAHAAALKQPSAEVSAVTGKARLFGFDKDAGVDREQAQPITPAQRERYAALAREENIRLAQEGELDADTKTA